VPFMSLAVMFCFIVSLYEATPSNERWTDFRVQFDIVTKEGHDSFVVKVHPRWAPVGAKRFKELVEAKFYDDVRFFRVIPSFMVQWGLSGKAQTTMEWRSQTIVDDPVSQSNKPGYITFAKTGAPNSRTTQLFINYGDNARLDSMGFAPFGEVEGTGMDVVRKIYNCGEAPDQGRIQQSGNSYLDSEFPDLSRIIKARLLPDAGVPVPQPGEALATGPVDVACDSTAGAFTLRLFPAWSPLGVARMLELVEAGFFDDQVLYRVIPGFLVQFGVAADPSVQAKWNDKRIKDEPHKHKFEHGTVSFAGAGADSRSCHIFIAMSPQGLNLGSALHEAPLGKIVHGIEFLDTLQKHYRAAGYRDLTSLQGQIGAQGNAAAAKYPKLDRMLQCRRVPHGAATKPAATKPAATKPAATKSAAAQAEPTKVLPPAELSGGTFTAVQCGVLLLVVVAAGKFAYGAIQRNSALAAKSNM